MQIIQNRMIWKQSGEKQISVALARLICMCGVSGADYVNTYVKFETNWFLSVRGDKYRKLPSLGYKILSVGIEHNVPCNISLNSLCNRTFTFDGFFKGTSLKTKVNITIKSIFPWDPGVGTSAGYYKSSSFHGKLLSHRRSLFLVNTDSLFFCSVVPPVNACL